MISNIAKPDPAPCSSSDYYVKALTYLAILDRLISIIRRYDE